MPVRARTSAVLVTFGSVTENPAGSPAPARFFASVVTGRDRSMRAPRGPDSGPRGLMRRPIRGASAVRVARASAARTASASSSASGLGP